METLSILQGPRHLRFDTDTSIDPIGNLAVTSLSTIKNFISVVPTSDTIVIVKTAPNTFSFEHKTKSPTRTLNQTWYLDDPIPLLSIDTITGIWSGAELSINASLRDTVKAIDLEVGLQELNIKW